MKTATPGRQQSSLPHPRARASALRGQYCLRASRGVLVRRLCACKVSRHAFAYWHECVLTCNMLCEIVSAQNDARFCTQAAKEQEVVVGIDLGTTNSAVAVRP